MYAHLIRFLIKFSDFTVLPIHGATDAQNLRRPEIRKSNGIFQCIWNGETPYDFPNGRSLRFGDCPQFFIRPSLSSVTTARPHNEHSIVHPAVLASPQCLLSVALQWQRRLSVALTGTDNFAWATGPPMYYLQRQILSCSYSYHCTYPSSTYTMDKSVKVQQNRNMSAPKTPTSRSDSISDQPPGTIRTATRATPSSPLQHADGTLAETQGEYRQHM